MPDFPAGVPDIPDSSTAETLFTMHSNAGHVPATNRILLNLRSLAGKLGLGVSTPSTAGVLRQNGAGNSAWGQVQNADIQNAVITPAKLNAGAVANQVVRTTDGVTALWGKLVNGDFGVGQVAPDKLFAGGITNKMLQTADGSTALWGNPNVAMLGAGGAANTALVTADGTTPGWSKVLDAMIGAGAVSALSVAALTMPNDVTSVTPAITIPGTQASVVVAAGTTASVLVFTAGALYNTVAPNVQVLAITQNGTGVGDLCQVAAATNTGLLPYVMVYAATLSPGTYNFSFSVRVSGGLCHIATNVLFAVALKH